MGIAFLAVAFLPVAGASHQSAGGLSDQGCAATKGGWGQNANGHNVGALLDEWWDEVVGDELVVGDLTFDDPAAVRTFIGGNNEQLEEQAVALALNILFGDAGLLDGTVSDVEGDSSNAALDGLTAVEALAMAEEILWNDPTPTNREYSDLIDLITGFNEEKFGCHETPDCPPGLTAIPQPNGAILLDWTAVDGATDYDIYRATGDGALAFIASTSDTTFEDATVAPGVSYSYVVNAFDGVLSSEDCPAVVAIAVPFFGGPILATMALIGTVGAFAWMRRRKA